MYNYEKCNSMMDALIQYQSNVRAIMISLTDQNDIRSELFDNDQEFLDYLTGRIKNADSAANQDV